MDGYYGNYLTNSNVYRNLNKAMDEIKLQIDKISDLSAKLENTSGNLIDIQKEDLRRLIDELENYYENLNNICNQLKNNSEKFDSILNEWKNKEKGTEEAYTDFEPPVVYIPYTNGENTITDKLMKKIKKVEVGSDGYIHVTVWKFISRTVRETETNSVVVEECCRIDKGTEDHIVPFDGNIGSKPSDREYKARKYRIASNAGKITEKQENYKPGGGSSGGHGF